MFLLVLNHKPKTDTNSKSLCQLMSSCGAHLREQRIAKFPGKALASLGLGGCEFSLWVTCWWHAANLWYLPAIKRGNGRLVVLASSWVVLSVLSLSRLSPRRGFLPRLTWAHPPPSHPSWFSSSSSSFRLLLRLPSVCSVDSFIQYLIHRLLCRTPFTRITFFQNPGLNTCLGLNKSNVFVSNHLLHWHKALFYTTPVLYADTMFYMLGLCKRCLRLAEQLFP